MKDDTLLVLLLGGLAGAGVTILGWFMINRAIDAQLSQGGIRMLEQGEAALSNELVATLEREVPPKVRTAVQQKLDEVGLDRTTGTRIAAVLRIADSTGLIGLRGLSQAMHR